MHCLCAEKRNKGIGSQKIFLMRQRCKCKCGGRRIGSSSETLPMLEKFDSRIQKMQMGLASHTWILLKAFLATRVAR
jgi:hypothetical protein